MLYNNTDKLPKNYLLYITLKHFTTRPTSLTFNQTSQTLNHNK